MRGFRGGYWKLNKNVLPRSLFIATAAVLGIGSAHAEDNNFIQTNLVSDLSGVAALTDLALKNPWGISHSPSSPFWSSNQGTSTATLYAVTNKTTVTKVNINPPAGNVLLPTTATGPQ